MAASRKARLPSQVDARRPRSLGVSAVIGRLSRLQSLPDGAWKMHAGDLAHGEAVDLDESGWQPIAQGRQGAQRRGLVSPDLSRSRHPQRLRPHRRAHLVPVPRRRQRPHAGDPLLQRPPRGHGRRSRARRALRQAPSPATRSPSPSSCCTPSTTRRFRGATLRIDFPESRPNPEDLRAGVPLRRAADSLARARRSRIPSPRSNGAIARRRSERLSTRTTRPQFDASLKARAAKLEALKPLLQQATFHLTGNSHIDAAWLWPWTETVDVVKRTFGTALQLMYEYPQYTYTQSAAEYNEWMAQKYPDMNAEIEQRIKEGRWEIVGGMWVEPDLNMPDGESLVRQLLVGKRWYQAGLRRRRAHRLESRFASATHGSCRRSTRRAASTISSPRR